MKLAAVDIGSNAIRLQVSSVLNYNNQISFKKVEYLRFPLRLGQDVFTKQEIGKDCQIKFFKLMQAFKILIDLYEVEDYMICATSAMREAKNGPDLANKIMQELGLKINIIDGGKEAEMINCAINFFIDERTYLHVDVGGGSTELNLYIERKKVISESFPVGSVKKLNHVNSSPVYKQITSWIKEHVKKKHGEVITIATGGNIRKLFELSQIPLGGYLSYEKAIEVQKFIASYSLEERINVLRMNPDRADVIIPAMELYLNVMELAGSKKILAPEVGLRDGILQFLLEKNKNKLILL